MYSSYKIQNMQQLTMGINTNTTSKKKHINADRQREEAIDIKQLRKIKITTNTCNMLHFITNHNPKNI